MFTAIHTSFLYQKSLQNASLDQKEEWDFDFGCSDENKLARNPVVKDVGLSE